MVLFPLESAISSSTGTKIQSVSPNWGLSKNWAIANFQTIPLQQQFTLIYLALLLPSFILFFSFLFFLYSAKTLIFCLLLCCLFSYCQVSSDPSGLEWRISGMSCGIWHQHFGSRSCETCVMVWGFCGLSLFCHIWHMFYQFEIWQVQGARWPLPSVVPGFVV